jgi:phosphatidylserine decarboxylase
MKLHSLIAPLVRHEGLNFVLTNRLPRRALTRLAGWFSRIENPLICAASIAVWRCFTELDLSDARTTNFRSLHACFTRELKPGARTIDPDPAHLVSPCDAIVGAFGRVDGNRLLQIKGQPYTLDELFGAPADIAACTDGVYVTLRLTSAMYHHFHAPGDGRIVSVTHLFGDVWNVNPPTLRRVPKLYCKNERAIIRTRLTNGQNLTLVAVAAILVAGIRLRAVDLSRGDRTSARRDFPCDAAFRKGEELGWFEHGSTIIVFAPRDFALDDGLREGMTIRLGQTLMRMNR